MPKQPQRRDLLQECDDKKVPVQEILQGWCPRCVNPGCTRSQWGKSRFDDRVLNWEERLFLNPAKLDPTDPRYVGISAKNFLTIAPGTPGAASDWIDPRHTRVEPAMVVVPATVMPVPEPYAPPMIVEAPKAVTSTPVMENVTPEPAIVAQKAPLSPPAFQNTPAKPQQMIDGGPRASQTSVLDPWAPKPSPSGSREQVVAPGAKIKFGGD